VAHLDVDEGFGVFRSWRKKVQGGEKWNKKRTNMTVL
jgi:hypothetical protein